MYSNTVCDINNVHRCKVLACCFSLSLSQISFFLRQTQNKNTAHCYKIYAIMKQTDQTNIYHHVCAASPWCRDNMVHIYHTFSSRYTARQTGIEGWTWQSSPPRWAPSVACPSPSSSGLKSGLYARNNSLLKWGNVESALHNGIAGD